MAQGNHPLHSLPELFRVLGGDPVVLAGLDLHGETEVAVSFERRPERGHFVHDATERPDVRLLVVLLLVDLLGRHVVRRAHMGLGKLGLAVHDPRQAEVADLGVVVGVKKNVAGLKVAVQDFLGAL